jgi:hypothetical protein
MREKMIVFLLRVILFLRFGGFCLCTFLIFKLILMVLDTLKIKIPFVQVDDALRIFVYAAILLAAISFAHQKETDLG